MLIIYLITLGVNTLVHFLLGTNDINGKNICVRLTSE